MTKTRDEMDEWVLKILQSLGSDAKPGVMARPGLETKIVYDAGSEMYTWVRDYLNPIYYKRHDHILTAREYNLQTSIKTMTLKKPFTGISASEANEYLKSFPPVPFYPDKCDCELCRGH